MADLTPLAGMMDLRSLNLAGTGVADLTPLAGMTGPAGAQSDGDGGA